MALTGGASLVTTLFSALSTRELGGGACVYVYLHTPTSPSTLAGFSTRPDYGWMSSIRPLGAVLYLPSWCVVSALPPASVPQVPYD